MGINHPVPAAREPATTTGDTTDLLRRPPAQRRSKVHVAAILDIAAQASPDPELRTTTLAELVVLYIADAGLAGPPDPARAVQPLVTGE